MLNLGPFELFAIFIVALLVFGPNKLPEIGRQVGRAVREFRKIQSSFQDELRDVFEDAPPGPLLPGAPTAAQAPEDNGAAATPPASGGATPGSAEGATDQGGAGEGATGQGGAGDGAQGGTPDSTSR